MTLLLNAAHAIGMLNAPVLAFGRAVGAACMGLMVVIILTQVFCRYVLGSALAWPEEASRFLMLWATGLMAPTAFRRGGFVAIDMLLRVLPRLVTALLAVFTLLLILTTLWIGLEISWREVTGLGGRFETDSLRVPASLDLSTWIKVPKAWMMASMLTGLALLFSVGVEMLLRAFVIIAGGSAELRVIPDTITLGVE
jgi:TRAP-type C4-dicarboxylate transport system permease small subunit